MVRLGCGRSVAGFFALIAALSGCSGKETTGACAACSSTVADGGGGQGGSAGSSAPDASTPGAGGSGGASPSTAPDGGLCLLTGSPSCSTLTSLGASAPTTAEPTLVLAARGAPGFLVVTSTPLVGQNGDASRLSYVDRAGGCLEPVSAEYAAGPTSTGVEDAAVGGGVRAAVMRCYYKFGCGSWLHVNGVEVLPIDDRAEDLYNAGTHRLAVSEDGTILLAEGPRVPNRGTTAPPGQPLAPGAAGEFRVRTLSASGQSIGPEKRWSEPESALLGVESVGQGQFALLTATGTDGGFSNGSLRLFSADGNVLASQDTPADLSPELLRRAGDWLLVAGHTVSTGDPWFAGFEASTLALRFQKAVSGPPVFGIGTDLESVFLGLADSAGGAEIRRFDLSGTGESVVATFVQARGGNNSLGVAPDGQILLGAGSLIGRCVPP